MASLAASLAFILVIFIFMAIFATKTSHALLGTYKWLVFSVIVLGALISFYVTTGSRILQHQVPEGANTPVAVRVSPGATVLYWDSDEENATFDSVSDWRTVVVGFKNAGFTTADEKGLALMYLRTPKTYVNASDGSIESYVYYCECAADGQMGPRRTAIVRGSEAFQSEGTKVFIDSLSSSDLYSAGANPIYISKCLNTMVSSLLGTTAPPAVVTAPPAVVTAPPAVVTAPPAVVTAPPAVVTAPPAVVTAPPAVVTAPSPAASLATSRPSGSALIPNNPDLKQYKITGTNLSNVATSGPQFMFDNTTKPFLTYTGAITTTVTILFPSYVEIKELGIQPLSSGYFKNMQIDVSEYGTNYTTAQSMSLTSSSVAYLTFTTPTKAKSLKLILTSPTSNKNNGIIELQFYGRTITAPDLSPLPATTQSGDSALVPTPLTRGYTVTVSNTSSSELYSGSNMFNTDMIMFWMTSSGITTATVTMKFPTSVTITTIGMIPFIDNGIAKYFRNITLQVSQDNGATYTDVQSWTNQIAPDFNPVWYLALTSPLTAQNVRLSLSNSSPSANNGIRKLQFYGSVGAGGPAVAGTPAVAGVPSPAVSGPSPAVSGPSPAIAGFTNPPHRAVIPYNAPVDAPWASLFGGSLVE